MGLFVVNAAFAATGLPQQLLTDLRSYGVDLNNPLALFLVTGVLSTIVGNNPSVMLLVPFLTPEGNADSLGAASFWVLVFQATYWFSVVLLALLWSNNQRHMA